MGSQAQCSGQGCAGSAGSWHLPSPWPASLLHPVQQRYQIHISSHSQSPLNARALEALNIYAIYLRICAAICCPSGQAAAAIRLVPLL